MKARVKATGEIVEVMQVYDKGKPSFERLDVLDTKVIKYSIDELDFSEEIGLTRGEYWEALGGKAEPIYPDYWTRLEHQYAGMAMQGILSNIDLLMSLAKKKADDYPAKYTVAEFAKDCAHALVEKYKKEERK